jgi:hypothetical protein
MAGQRLRFWASVSVTRRARVEVYAYNPDTPAAQEIRSRVVLEGIVAREKAGSRAANRYRVQPRPFFYGERYIRVGSDDMCGGGSFPEHHKLDFGKHFGRGN